MPLPRQLDGRLKVPAIAAPMLLGSGPDLVVEVCKAGMIGAFPALNQRTSEGYADWLVEISERLQASDSAAPFAVNLIVHRSNPRLEADLKITAAHKVPIIITSLGSHADVVAAVHEYGGLVFHDIINLRHAEKAVEAGVDGIVAVCAGAGGHGGTLSPFALIPEIRKMFDGAIILSGSMSTGNHIAAARVMGADLAYLGTRFLATEESMVDPEHKRMITQTAARDIVYTPSISGVAANFMRPSIERAGLDPDDLPEHGALDMKNEAKAWKSVWSAGQGVGSIDDIPPAADLCAQLARDYSRAMTQASADAFVNAQARA